MIKGIGIDAVSIIQISEITGVLKEGASLRLFTEKEMAAALRTSSEKGKAEYLASRFAAKEAVFKALAPLLSEKSFDFRMVETLNREDGSPYVNMTDSLISLCKKAGVIALHISITTEVDFAIAFVVAEG